MPRFFVVCLLALCCAACAHASGASSPADQAVLSAQHLSPKARYKLARPVALAYVKALAHQNPSGAEAFVGNSGYSQLSSLTTLQTWFSLIPSKQLRVTASAMPVSDVSAVGVHLVLSARLGPAPLTPWVKLGDRVLLVQDQKPGWRVVADISRRPKLHLKTYGLALFAQPHFLSAPHMSVVYGPDDAELAARTIEGSGQQVVKMLHSKYGGGAAARHPLVYMVSGLHQGEVLAGVKIGRKETPAGWQVGDFAYIDYPVWLQDDLVTQDSTVAHELTHVASHTMLSGAPHSLIEGVAMYEEERFLNKLGFERPFALIDAYYQHGFPSAEIWGIRYTDWGLRAAVQVEACYQDGQAMTAVIIEEHGGVPALARLAAAYRRYHTVRYSSDQVHEAFESALGVSFETVVAEAHAYAAAHA